MSDKNLITIFEIKGVLSALGGFLIFGLPTYIFLKQGRTYDANMYATTGQLISLTLMLPTMLMSKNYFKIAEFSSRGLVTFQIIKLLKKN